MGSVAMIDGRAGRATLDPAVQNWESGIALTVIGCTLFRNFAGFGNALSVMDTWPFVGIIESADFIHNEGLLAPNDGIGWVVDGFMGADRRFGVASLAITNSHWDGGFSSAGVFTYALSGSVSYVDANGEDEPDARWEVTSQGCDFVDHGGFYSVHTVCHRPWPILPDTQIRYDYTLADSVVTDSVGMAPSDLFDATYIILSTPEGSYQVDRCRFERSGNFNPAAVAGTGGISLFPPPGGSYTVTFEFADSDWIGNAAGSGPAVYAVFGNYHLAFVRCLFRENTAYKGGGAIAVMGPASSTLLVDDSIFDANAVRVPMDGAGMDVTVPFRTSISPCPATFPIHLQMAGAGTTQHGRL
eukprot:COSAG04_NODE_797_length_10240_cov_3.294547_5_plen_357_part_00